MITHEEARNMALDMLPKKIGSISSRNKVNKYFELDGYFKQQEAQSKRLAKVEELLELYKQYYNKIPIGKSMYKVELEIERLEKELEEIK